MSARIAVKEAMSGGSDRIVGLGNHPFLSIYAKNLVDRPGIFLDIPAAVSVPHVQTRGFVLRASVIDDRTQVLIHTQTPEQDSPPLVVLADTLFSATSAAGSLTESVNEISRVIQDFRHFFERDASQLGESSVRGLFAELLLLGDLANALNDIEPALVAWGGPYGGRDFQFTDGSTIEVKSVHANASKVRVSSEFQLEPGVATSWLLVRPLANAAASDREAVSLLDLAARISQAVAGRREPSDHWSMALAALGVDLADPYYEKFRYRPLEASCFAAGDPAFPAITPALVPPGVSKVAYDIELRSLHPFQVQTSSIYEKFRELND